jgi:hypothetical protein
MRPFAQGVSSIAGWKPGVGKLGAILVASGARSCNLIFTFNAPSILGNGEHFVLISEMERVASDTPPSGSNIMLST